MQLKAAELIGNIRKAGSNPQAPYMQLAGMTDELAVARYGRFINKRFSELRAEPIDKIQEESRDLPFSTPEQQDGGIEPPPVLSSRFFRFLNLP